jgi:imidazolonepropionase-like amidohydrolase
LWKAQLVIRPVRGLWLVVTAIGCAAGLGAQQPTLIIRDVAVVDAIHPEAIVHRDVVIREGRIERILPAGEARFPADAVSIDGRGKFLAPGLWDMHTHSGGYAAAVNSYPGLLRRGIVGVRDMGTPLTDIVAIRDSLKSGALTGPHLVYCGPLIQGPLPFSSPLMAQVRSRADVRRVVDSIAAAGASCLKVHDGLPADLWRVVIAVAKAKRLPVVGHLPPSVPAIEAAMRGQRSIEHLGGRFLGVLLGSSAREAELRAAEMRLVDSIMAAIRGGREADDMLIYRAPFAARLAESQTIARRRALIDAFVTHGTWQTPTLVALPVRALLARTDTTLLAADRAADERLLRLTDVMVREMWRAGVPILAGTDSPLDTPRIVDELDLLVRAGLSPLAAIQSATRNAALFLGRRGSGTIAIGQTADLVMVSGNPLLDVRNLTRVETVIFAGRIVSGR